MIDYLEYDYFEPNELAFTLAEGPGTFKIMQVLPGMSKAGNDMLTINFKVQDYKGKEGYIDDYLVATKGDEAGMKRLATKIRNIANALNKPELYAPGVKLKPEDLVGYSGKCEIKTQKSDGYPDKSVISKYIDATKVQDTMVPDDSLPF